MDLAVHRSGLYRIIHVIIHVNVIFIDITVTKWVNV